MPYLYTIIACFIYRRVHITLVDVKYLPKTDKVPYVIHIVYRRLMIPTMTLELAPLYNIRKLQRHQNLAYLFVCKFPEIFKKERSINRSRTRRNFHSQKPVYKPIQG